MLRMILRKMMNNRWIVGSLLLGLIITVALVSSIPSYTSGVLQRLLISELEEHQLRSDEFPGGLYQFISFRNIEETETHPQLIEEMETNFKEDIRDYVQLPVLNHVTILTTRQLQVGFEDQERYDDDNIRSSFFRVNSLTHIEDHIELTDGEMPSSEPVDGVYEALVSEPALMNLDAVLDTVFEVTLPGDEESGETILIQPVGTFEPSDNRDPYWVASVNTYSDSFIIQDELFRNELLGGEEEWLANLRLFTAYDYHSVGLQDVDHLLNVENRLQRGTNQIMPASDYDVIEFPIRDILVEYMQQENQLRTLLWSLNVPVLIMLGLYLFMVSRLIVDRQQTEIAVLRSRGAGRIQILLIYLVEVGILGAVAFIVGPFIGLGLSRILGASSGFLEFVNRTALPVQLTAESYQYALWAVIASIVMIMIPVLLATGKNIVSHKQQAARMMGSALWHKFFLDILLLLISWYGWSMYRRRQQDIMATQIDAGMMTVDPLLFFVPAMFVIGLGLLCLRVYPWLVRLVNWLGQKYWPPSMYATMVQVGRASRQYQFLMLFLVMTIAIGIFSASAARTINNNLEEQLRYEYGTDVALQVEWESDAPATPMGGTPRESGEEQEEEEPVLNLDEGLDEGEVVPEEDRVQYTEPPFSPFEELPGVEHATKVFTKDEVNVEGNNESTGGVDLMAIEPRDFGLTAWFKPQLMPHHWYNHLNLLADEPTAVLISRSLANALGVREGDHIELSWSGAEQAQFSVYAIIDYWPSWNPISEEGPDPQLVVANLPYVQNAIGLEPYHVWLNMEDDATSEDLYAGIEEEEIRVIQINDVRQELIELTNSAFLLGINGALTLGFLISLAITFCGFLLYWILTLKSRVLQYGIFRAMGLSLRQLIGMMTWEQLLTSGVACLLGVVIGGITSRLFVPLFQLSFEAGSEVPPFQVIFETSDEVRLYVFVSLMLGTGLFILGWLLSRIRIHQAVKLGED